MDKGVIRWGIQINGCTNVSRNRLMISLDGDG